MYNENEKTLIWLSLANFVTYKKRNELLQLFNEPSELWDNFTKQSAKIKNIINEDDFKKMEFNKDDSFIKSYVSNCKDQGIEIVTLVSDNYSKLLAETDNPPFVLYCKGDLSLLNTNSIAVVGTRRPTRYGKDITEKFVKDLSNAGLTIVSGLADGIDAIAHKTTLTQNGKTIAVLGCGLNEIYPLSNVDLYKKVAKNGLIISEYTPNEKPQAYYFPARNRIIAGLSKAVLITEATEKSGTMHTKNYALDYNRNLFAVPGRITDKNSVGCNKIIQNLQSSIALSAEDILSFYNLELKETNQTVVQLDFNDEIVYNLIASTESEIHYEEILSKTNLDTRTLNTVLIRLELKDLIKKLSGNYYCKKLS